jgi:putative colanic acid biosynthesis glycosyltransferase
MSKGWGSYIAYGRKSNESASKTIRIGSELAVALHGLLSRLLDRHGLGSIKATKTLLNEIRKINPDIIHLHNIHGYYINYEILFEYLATANIPIVWTLHDCWPLTGHCTHFSNINCIKWKTECHHCPKKKNYPTSLIIDRSRHNYKFKRHHFISLDNLTIVPVSRWLGTIIQESFLAKYPTFIINNGIDTTAFYPVSDCSEIRMKYGITEKFILLGVATAWDAGKGWDDYCKLSQVLSDDYVIVLVGLSKKQKKLLPSNIIGIERTESIKELRELYSTANIVLNLSCQETFGMTTIEGFACGTPGIVYNVTASPELITKETGCIVEPGNIEQVVKAIEIIKSNGKEFYTANCRKRAEKSYNEEVRYSDYFKVYNRLIIKKSEI